MIETSALIAVICGLTLFVSSGLLLINLKSTVPVSLVPKYTSSTEVIKAIQRQHIKSGTTLLQNHIHSQILKLAHKTLKDKNILITSISHALELKEFHDELIGIGYHAIVEGNEADFVPFKSWERIVQRQDSKLEPEDLNVIRESKRAAKIRILKLTQLIGMKSAEIDVDLCLAIQNVPMEFDSLLYNYNAIIIQNMTKITSNDLIDCTNSVICSNDFIDNIKQSIKSDKILNSQVDCFLYTFDEIKNARFNLLFQARDIDKVKQFIMKKITNYVIYSEEGPITIDSKSTSPVSLLTSKQHKTVSLFSSKIFPFEELNFLIYNVVVLKYVKTSCLKTKEFQINIKTIN